MENPSLASKFNAICCVFFGLTSGVLIGLPLSVSPEDATLSSPGFILAFGTLGALAGYRRRRSKLFFYISLIATVTLLTVLGFAWVPS